MKGLGDWLFTIEEIDPSCPLAASDSAPRSTDEQRSPPPGSSSGRAGPDKHAIYPDRLDPGCRTDPPAPTPNGGDAIRAGRAAGLHRRRLGGLLAARAADTGGPGLFYTEDSHWTPTGAIAAIRPLIESFGPGLWSDTDVTPGRPEQQMELAGQLGLSRSETAGVEVRPTVKITRGR